MAREDYVSLEVVKLLQEKGFREPCNAVYFVNQKGDSEFRELELTHFDDLMMDIYGFQYEYLAPTLYEAQKWLRTKKGLHVEVSYMSGDYWLYEILTIPNHDLIGLSDIENMRYMRYEYALMDGILD